MKTIIRSHSRIWRWWEHLFSFQVNTYVRAMLYHPFMSAFFKGRKSALTRFSITQKFYRTCGYVLALDSSRSCSLDCCQDHLLMKHSTIAQLISQRYKFSHKSLETLWLLVSFQRSADFSVKLGLGRKKYLENF